MYGPCFFKICHSNIQYKDPLLPMWWCCSLWMSLCSNWKRIFFFLCISSHQKCFFLLKEQPSFSLFTISIFCLEQFRVNSFMLETMMKWSGNTAVFKICASKFIFCNLYTATVVIVILESDFWDFFFDMIPAKITQPFHFKSSK